MDVKVPTLSNCCCFVPLRAGLIIFGYINLVYHVLSFISAVYGSLYITMFMTSVVREFPPIEVWLLTPLLKIAEVTFYVFVVAATHDHMKDTRLFKVTLILGTALFIFTVPYSICIVSRLGISANTRPNFNEPHLIERFTLSVYVSTSVFDPILLGYTLLLVRSLKLQPRGETEGESIDLERNRALEADNEPLLPTPTTQ